MTFKQAESLARRALPCPFCGERLIAHSDHHGAWVAHKEEPGPCIDCTTQLMNEKDLCRWNDRATADWYDDAHPPTRSGLYYWESCDQYGNPSPGLYLLEEGKEPKFPQSPFKLFGPIRGAMHPWPMVPV